MADATQQLSAPEVLAAIDAKFYAARAEAASHGDGMLQLALAIAQQHARRMASSIAAAGVGSWGNILQMLFTTLEALFPVGTPIGNILALILSLLPTG